MPWYITIDTYCQSFAAGDAQNAYALVLDRCGTGSRNPAAVQALNLTPHKVEWRNAGYHDKEGFSLPSEGTVRVAESFEELPFFDGEIPSLLPFGRMRYGLPVFSIEIPQDNGPLALVVSTLAAGPLAEALAAGRVQLPPDSIVLVPDSGSTAIRDAAGKMVAITRWIVAWGDPVKTRHQAEERAGRFNFEPYDPLWSDNEALAAKARSEHNAGAAGA